MGDRVQTSLWIKKELKHIVDNEDLNLSQFVNNALEKYFSVSSVEDIDNKLVKLREQIRILEQKRADLLAQGVAESKDQAVAEEVEKELKEIYKSRRDSGVQRDLDRSWLSSPRNLERLRVIGWQVDEAVHRLRSWYDGEKESE